MTALRPPADLGLLSELARILVRLDPMPCHVATSALAAGHLVGEQQPLFADEDLPVPLAG